ncbi:TetR family transcriptional regulator [Modestobacter sp. VKM Ac-2984]|uniref:TetR family transcriptional regulator n=1 Tax=Modestobacter sp. VKM Ac-2984 TaxID=3004138 RepID=UPI0022AAE1B4|nr:TetR family transcriptional regulator [Modestobacter sp. VKM Ac-2984]MCZ2816306.1 TetR family transcriptional regulator [Modestobacter sp. VKM Ac-2984]
MSSAPVVPAAPTDGAKTDRWRRLRSAAIDLFAERGFAEVSIDDIAGRAGVSRRTFFNHFDSKAAALFDPDPTEQAVLASRLAEHAGGGAWTGLTTALEEHLVAEHRVVAARRQILANEPELDRHHVVANAKFEVVLHQWLREQGLAPFPARVVAGIALACVRETFMSWDAAAGPEEFTSSLRDAFALAAAGTATGISVSGGASVGL